MSNSKAICQVPMSTDFLALQQRLDSLLGPIIGHNLFNFDYLVLRRHLNLEHIVEKSADTLHFLY